MLNGKSQIFQTWQDRLGSRVAQKLFSYWAGEAVDMRDMEA